ncbi:MAG TPA: lipoate--protein ligase family protein [Anaerolineales bacterium]
MTDLWRVLITPPAHGAWNMAVDESILEHIGRGESRPTLRLYAWEPACLSLGHAQPFSDVDEPRLMERGWEVVRRPTGGRAILHTDELTYSIIGPADNPHLAGSILESYNRLACALLRAVRSLGLDAQSNPLSPEFGGASHGSVNPVCFEVPSAYEITAAGKKLIGSAQARRKEGVLQHGSLPLTGDLRRITEALVFPDEAARIEAAQRLLARATTLEMSLGRVVTWEEAARAFVDAFKSELGLGLETGDLTESESRRTSELVELKYKHPGWMQRV